jgi:hypothetical protein
LLKPFFALTFRTFPRLSTFLDTASPSHFSLRISTFLHLASPPDFMSAGLSFFPGPIFLAHVTHACEQVSRSLAACEGVLLLVDAAQGIQAQTMANYLLATKANLAIIPVVNKIDLPGADVAKVCDQVRRS